MAQGRVVDGGLRRAWHKLSPMTSAANPQPIYRLSTADCQYCVYLIFIFFRYRSNRMAFF